MTYLSSPKYIGFLQALGLAGYIGVFAMSLFRIQNWVHTRNISPHPIMGIMLFLLAFVISALICSSLIFAYPVVLFFDGRRRDALQTVLWSGLWLVTIFLFVAIGTFLMK